ncbi:MAG: DUF5591 domain-containing protein [Candidatus Methanofastidiosa archaeon]|nr:DUF5591 domain-containing protein [Candidatus Methanofastidiosa archaeon]
MIEIFELDGHRIGCFNMDGHEIGLPNLIKMEKDHLELADLIISKPLSYPFRHINQKGDMRASHHIRLSRGLPIQVARRIQSKNAAIGEGGDVTMVYLSGYKELDDAFIDSLEEAKIFMFEYDDARSLFDAFFRIREKHPNSMCYCDCGPDAVPVLAYAGFDLFKDTEDNRRALEKFLEEKTPQYVEMSACSSLGAKTLLDHLYLNYWNEFEKYVSQPRSKEMYISRDSFWRPVVQRWAKSVKAHYDPGRRVFLLLPCSSRKPYSDSPSHRRFIDVIRSVLGNAYPSICQLIVTSPYGVVPRELETLIDYDIVVTGKWTSEEVGRSADMLKTIVSSAEDPIVIAHLPENELDVIQELEAKVLITTDGHPLSDDSLKNLKEALAYVKDELDVPKDKYGDVRMLSKFLYGSDIFPEKIYIKGRGIKQVFAEGRAIASLTKGLRPLASDVDVTRRYVDIDFEVKGDLFCVGVKDAEDGIRPGDEVVIRRNGRSMAVGTAVLPGDMMKKMRKGKAVKIRKRFD